MSATNSPDLRNLTDDALAECYAAGAGEMLTAILAEADRRERKARRTAIDKARWAAVYDEWAVAAHAQYLAAEAECRGNLVNRESAADVADPFSLWTGSHAWAMRCATEELKDFWAISPRITVTAFREMQRAANREARREAEGE